MAIDPRAFWLLIYGAVALALLSVSGVIAVIAWQSLRPHAADFTYIERHAQSIGRRCVRVERTSNFLRIPLGGIFALSNIARIYQFVTELPTGETRVAYYAADPLTGAWKVRLGRRWSEV